MLDATPCNEFEIRGHDNIAQGLRAAYWNAFLSAPLPFLLIKRALFGNSIIIFFE
jgi:hypothetical protein